MPRGIQKRLTKDGRVSYRVRLQARGRPTLSATFPRLADALEWQKRQEAAQLMQAHFPARQAQTVTCAAMLDRYCAEVLPRKRPQTQHIQGFQLAWWREQLGHLRLTELTPRHLTAARDRLYRTHSAATVNRYLAALSHVCSVAMKEWEWLEVHPVQRIQRLREPRGRVRSLSTEEREALLAACQRSRSPYLYTVVILALTTGARKMELLRLRWSDVDCARGQVIFHERKNQERHRVPLVGEARELLQGLALRRDPRMLWVFPSCDGRTTRDIREAWEVARRRAGLVDFRFHDLRHTAASYLALSGASLFEISEILGHQNVQMTKRYTHLTESHITTVVERMVGQFLSGARGGS